MGKERPVEANATGSRESANAWPASMLARLGAGNSSTPGPKSLKNHDFPVEKTFFFEKKNCLDFSTPGPKSLKIHDFPVGKTFFLKKQIV